MEQKSPPGGDKGFSEFIELFMESEKKEKTKLQKFFAFMMPIVLAGITIGLATTVILSGKNSLVNKSNLEKKLATAILNGADLQVVKQIYKNRKIENVIFRNLFKNMDEYYTSEVALSEILLDANASIFLSDNIDSTLIQPLNKIILEHSQVYPFDKLELSQKDLFENIRIKIPDEYSRIQNDINKISDELYDKNLLVSKYLNKSNTSFWISIIALIFSLLIGALQLYQNRIDRFRNMLKSLLDERKTKEASSDSA